MIDSFGNRLVIFHNPIEKNKNNDCLDFINRKQVQLMKRVRIIGDCFQGSVEAGGEHIPICRKGDVITIQDRTWEILNKDFGNMFQLLADEYNIDTKTVVKYRDSYIKTKIKTIGIVMTVFDRPEYVEKSLSSLANTTFPKGTVTTIVIVNDNSTDKKIDKILKNFNIHGVNKVIFNNEENIRTWNCLIKGFDYLYNKNVDVMMSLDSDAIVKKDWLVKVLDLHKKFPETIVSGFNANSHKASSEIDTYYVKKTIGGINMVFNWGTYLDIIRTNLVSGLASWDWKVCDYINRSNMSFYVTKPSVIQHIGADSSLGHGGHDVALDF
jgi:hypothetical protein